MTGKPWETLTHDSVLNRIEKATGSPLTSLIIQRNSYINRVFEVECADTSEKWIAKFYRPNRWKPTMILQEHSLLNTLAQAEIQVIPPLSFNNHTLFDSQDIPFAIFPKKWGRAIDELTQDSWQQVGRLLGRIHAQCQTLPQPDRVIWKPSIASQKSADTLLKLNVIPEELLTLFNQKLLAFIEKNDPLFKNEDLFLIHGDCHLGNFISRAEEGIYLVDFDDCVIGPMIQDLWMLLPGKPEECRREIAWFAEGYETFLDFPDPQLKLIPALSVMRQLHFAAWCALQKDEPHFHHHFPHWGTTSYWEQLIRDMNTPILSHDEIF